MPGGSLALRKHPSLGPTGWNGLRYRRLWLLDNNIDQIGCEIIDASRNQQRAVIDAGLEVRTVSQIPHHIQDILSDSLLNHLLLREGRPHNFSGRFHGRVDQSDKLKFVAGREGFYRRYNGAAL